MATISRFRRVLFTAVAASALLHAPPARAQSSRAPDTNETVPVTRGTRLLINNFAGEVVVRAWNRDQVQVQARHNSRTRVNVRSGEGTLRINASSSSGTSSVDYDIRTPAWMPVRISGTFNDIQVEGLQADISAETVRGDVRVKGGSGVIALKSIEGEVHIEDARGRINASSVNEGVTIVRSSGDISAETVNGEISIIDAKAESAEATTVNGDVVYTGAISDNGLYRFSTHQGDILAGVPEKVNATVSVRTYQGEFQSSFPVKAGEVRRGRRQTFMLGNGSAQIEMESFGGEIRLGRPDEVSRRRDRPQRHRP